MFLIWSLLEETAVVIAFLDIMCDFLRQILARQAIIY